MPESTPDAPVRLEALDHVDSEGSVVRSGMLFADAVLRKLDAGQVVTASFKGLRGASSSYFNVFLRRIEEACGLAEIHQHIVVEFGTSVQKMVFDRSFDAMRKGVRQPSQSESPASSSQTKSAVSLWERLAHFLGGKSR